MGRINYRTDDLRALLAVHRTRSFVRGAELLHITQSAFSRRISQLEAALNAPLVERSTRHVAMSALGLELVNQAGPLLAGLDATLDEVGRQARGESGRISVACLTSVAFALLPSVLNQFRRKYPDVRLQLRDDTAERVTASVLQREAEFGISVVAQPNVRLCSGPEANDPYVVAFSPGHPLARRTSVRWEQLAEWRPMALRTRSTQQMDEALAAAGIDPPWFDEVEHLSSLLALLRSDIAIGVLPRLALSGGAKDLEVRPLVAPHIGRRVGLIRRVDSVLSQTATTLWDIAGNELLHFDRKMLRFKNRHKSA